jgi:hypothetical protein
MSLIFWPLAWAGDGVISVRATKHSSIFASCLLLLSATGLTERAGAAVYNLHLVTDNVPDYTNLESFVESIAGHLDTPQEKCIAVWRWGRRSRRQTSCSKEDGRLIWDPILHYNSYGTMNCGVISALNMAAWLKLGYKARYVQLSDHTVSEVSWDDGASWHLFDSSMSFFCYNDRGLVASCEEIKEPHAGKFSGGASEPGYYYYYNGASQCVSHRGKDGWRCCSDNPVAYQRTLFNGASSYTDGVSVDEYTLHVRCGHRYILGLQPWQSYTRYWKPLGCSDSPAAGDDERNYYRPLDGKDPDEQHDLHNIRGNGVWLFEPDLRSADCRDVFYDACNVEIRVDGGSGPALHPARSGQPAQVVFEVSAANVITSMQIAGEGVRRGPDEVLRVLVSRYAGIGWTPVWEAGRTGLQPIEIQLRDEVAGVTECLVKVEMSPADKATGVGLNRLRFTTITQVNRRTLPKLTLGANQVGLSADRQVETTVLWPPLHAGLYKKTVHQARNIYTDEEPDGMYKATLGAGANGLPCEATWRVNAPAEILGCTLGAVVTNRSADSYVSLQYSYDGEQFTEFYRKADGDVPFDRQVLHTLGPQEAGAAARAVYFRGVFFCKTNAATYNMPGIQDVLIQVEHRPRDARFRPIEVTYNWTEHRTSGDVTRSHVELAASLPHAYTINVAGRRDPTMNWVRMNLKGADPERRQVVYGYSDGEDVGGGFEAKPAVFTWGDNIALGKCYTASRPSSEASKNADTGGIELTNGKIVAPTDYVASEVVQAATAFWTSGDPVALVVDLGGVRMIGGARVSTHQPCIEYCHPARIDVAVSVDGKSWRHGGAVEHDDLWKPPGDYEPWEHDDSPQYADLPAGGRLAYSYPLAFEQPLAGRYVRVVCMPLEGRGMGLSEIEVFDRVGVSPAPALVASLPHSSQSH